MYEYDVTDTTQHEHPPNNFSVFKFTICNTTVVIKEDHKLWCVINVFYWELICENKVRFCRKRAMFYLTATK